MAFAQVRRDVFLDVFKDFFRKWWSGPNRVAKDMAREIGFATGVIDVARFVRDAGLLEWVLKVVPWRDFRKMNLFISVAFYFDIDGVEQAEAKALYDRIFYDFDSKDSSKLAIEKAIEFAKSLKARFRCDAVVSFSGLHGAHVTVPLKRPVTWSAYSKLWDALVAPYSFGALVDRKVREPRRIYRVPFTYNIKEDGVGYSYIIDLNGRRIRMEDFDWSSYEPLDPQSIEVIEFEADIIPKMKIITGSPKPKTIDTKPKARLPEDPAELDKCEAVPPCIRNIIHTLKTAGNPDHNQRLALVWYLKWVGYTVDVAVELFKRFAKDFNEKITRYHVEYAYGLRGKKEDWLAPSCAKLKQQGICVGCRWSEKHRNPVTYTYAMAEVAEETKQRFFNIVKQGIKETTAVDVNIPELATFLRESGFREFSYRDVKKWIESRFGSIDASKWHSIERSLRELAEKCVLGRKFLVDGEWVDYGCGTVKQAPGKEVRFYVVSS